MALPVPEVREEIHLRFTLDEFLEREERATVKHQLVAGKIYSMAGGTDAHSEIAVNVTAEIHFRLRGKDCGTLNSDMLVRIDEHNAVYPDVSVVCGERRFADDGRLALLNPVLVVEVTSPSTITDDRGWKLELYKSLPSLRACLIIDQQRIFAELHTRADDGWLLQTFDSLDELIPLAALNIELPMAQVYADVAGDLARN
ncbi:MAG: Uma2 family endonuclease [Chloroflexi bacterium]|nr:Uma2 family endonuclease [Chloroflexota bacterium]